MFNYGNITDKTQSRLYRALTDKGMSEYRANIKAGLTPRQALRKVRDASRASAQKSIERNKQYFVDNIGPIVLLSLKEYIDLLGEDLKKRWLTYPEKEIKPILKNWKSKTIDAAIKKFVQKELETWFAEKNVFYRMHVGYFEKAIFYGLPYNQEVYELYKADIKELCLAPHSSCFEYKD